MSLSQTRRDEFIPPPAAAAARSPMNHAILSGTADRPKRVLCEFSGLQIMALLEALVTSDTPRDPQMQSSVEDAERELEAALQDLTGRML
jgi:hypothetical protein